MKKASNLPAQSGRVTKSKVANTAVDDAAKIAAEGLSLPLAKTSQAGLAGTGVPAKSARRVWKDDEDQQALHEGVTDEIAYDQRDGDASSLSPADADMVAQAAAAVATDAAASGAAAGTSSAGAAAGSAGAAGAATGTAGAVGAAAAAAAIGPGAIVAGVLVGGAVIGGLGGSSGAPAAATQSTPLTAAVTIDKTALKAGETATVTIRFNKAVTGLSLDDLSVSAGAGNLSDLSAAVIGADGSATYTAKFTPAVDAELTDNLITLKGQAVLDAANLANESASISQKFSLDTKRPTATVTIDDTALAIGQTAQVTVTFSEKPTGFDPATDLGVANGTLSGGAFDATGKIYRATFTPTEKIEDVTNVIQLSKDWTDAAGNAPAVASVSANYAIDTKGPALIGKSIDRAVGVITLDFDEALALSITNGVIDPQQFTVQAINVATVSQVQILVQAVRLEGSKLILTMANALTETVDEKVTFTRGSSGALVTDTAGNLLEGFSPLRVSDGLIRDAKVLIEFTQNGAIKVVDTGLLTNDQGDFFLPASFSQGQYSNGTLIIRGGINIDTGMPNKLDMRVPLGVSAITPFTALSEAVDRYLIDLLQPAASLDTADAEVRQSLQGIGVESVASLTPGFSKSLMATAFGLPAGADVSKITPQSFGDLTNPPAAVILLQKIATQIVAITSEGIKANGQDGAAAVLEGLARQIVVNGVAGKTVDLSNPGVLQNAYQGLSVAADAVAAVADAAKVIATAGDLNAISAAQSQLFDTTLPNAPTALKVLDLAVGSTTISNSKPTVRVSLDTQSDLGGAAVVDDTVVLLNGGLQVGKKVITDADLAAGFVDLQPEYDIRDGAASFSAQVVDRAGNSSPAPAAGSSVPVVQVQIGSGSSNSGDTTAPAVPTINPIAGNNEINAVERTAGVTLSGTAEGDATVMISWGSGSAARQVSVKADGSSNDGGLTRSWSYPLTAADYRSLGTGAAISAVAIDAAGNRSSASTAITLKVDTVNPLLSAIEIANAQSAGVGLPVTADQTPELRFTVEAGARLEFDWDNDSIYDIPPIPSVDGTAGAAVIVRESAPNNLAEGPRTVRVKATDGALNETVRTVEFVVDKTAPAAGVISVDPLDSKKITIRFTEPVSTALAIADLSVAGETNAFGTGATLVPLDAAGERARAFLITLGTGETIDTSDVIKVAAAKAGDWLGNVPSADISFTVPNIDSTGPLIVGTPAIVKEANPAQSVVKLGPGQAALIKITFNEPVTGFGADDLVLSTVGGVSAGQLGAVTRINASEYHVTYLPALGLDGVVTLGLKPGSFSDLSKNANLAAPVGTINVDTKAATLSVASDDSALKQNEKATLTFTFSEPITGLTGLTASQVKARVKLSGEADISTFTEVSGSGGKIFTAVVTPKAAAAGVIDVGLEGWKDDADNPVSVLSRPKIAFDTAPPAAPGLTAGVLTDTWLNDAEATAGLSVRVTLNGSGLAAPVAGDKVELSLGGAVVASAALTPADAQAKFVDFKLNKTALGQDGAKSLAAKVTDAAGNESALSSALSFTLDTKAPAAPSATDMGAVVGDAWLNAVEVGPGLKVRVALAGAGETAALVGDSVQLFLQGAQSPLASATLLAGDVQLGYVEFTVTKAQLGNDGAKALVARVVDQAGNVGSLSSALSFTMDTTAPEVPTPSPALSIPENSGASLLTLSSIVLAEPVTWAFVDEQTSLFKVDPNTTQLSPKTPFDFEALPAGNKNVPLDFKVTDRAGNVTQKQISVTVTNVNDAPTVANAIPDQIFVVGGAVDTFAFSANAFADQDAGTTLTYSESLENGAALPGWLSFDRTSRTFSGNPSKSDEAVPLMIKVTASDGVASVSDIFKLTSVSAPTIQSFAVTDATTANGVTLGKAGEALTFTVKLSEAVTSTGALTATVNLNGTTVTATCAQVTAASDTLVFTGGTVPAGNNGAIITLTGITVAGVVVGQSSGQQMVPLAAPIAQSTTEPYTVDTKTPTVTTPTVGLAENSTAGYALLADESVVWTKGTGNDTDAFDLSSAGLLSFKTQRDYDTASQTLFTVNVVATDPAGNVKNQAVTVNLTNVNEAPSISSGATVEYAENGTGTVYTTQASDPDANTTLTYALSGPDALRFSVNSTTGVVTFVAVPNFEAPTDVGANNVYNFTVTVSDNNAVANGGSLTATKDVAVTVTNVNEAPVFVTPSAVRNLSENTAAVGNAAATDDDAGDAIVYSLSGTNASAFNLNTTTGALTFKSSPNYELVDEPKTYSVIVTATDKTSLTATQALTINITDIPEKIELRKSTAETNANVVTLEVWVDPGAAYESLGFDFDLRKSPAFSLNVDSPDSLVFDPVPRSKNWIPVLGSEVSNVYLVGAISAGTVASQIPDPSGMQRILSLAMEKGTGDVASIMPELSNIEFGVVGSDPLKISTVYSYVFAV